MTEWEQRELCSDGSCTGVIDAPVVSEPMPVPGLPPVIAAKPLLPADVTRVMPTSSIASVN